MIEALISSKTRINLLLKFFLNPERQSYLRGLSDEFGESTNAIRLELNKFEKAGMLDAAMEGNRKMFKANQKHPLFSEIRSIVLKHVGVDKLIDHLVSRMGNLEQVYLTGDYAKGLHSDIIDLILVGDIDRAYFSSLVEKIETQVNKKLRYLIYNAEEIQTRLTSNGEMLLIWNCE